MGENACITILMIVHQLELNIIEAISYILLCYVLATSLHFIQLQSPANWDVASQKTFKQLFLKLF